MRFWTLLALFLVLGPATASAQGKKQPEPMHIVIVRSTEAACERDCREWIAAQGAIVPGSLDQLRAVLASLKGRQLPVLLSSSGGSMSAAIAMGELVRKHRLDVAVANTAFEPGCEPRNRPCATNGKPGVIRGRVDAYIPRCASACTFVLAGGARRFIPPTARIGVHQSTTWRTTTTFQRTYQVVRRPADGAEVSRKLLRETSSRKIIKIPMPAGEVDRRLERHFEAMGLDRSFLAMTVATPADSMRYLQLEELAQTRIATHAAPPPPLFPLEQPRAIATALSTERKLADLGKAKVAGDIDLGRRRGQPPHQLQIMMSGRDDQTDTVKVYMRLRRGPDLLATSLLSTSFRMSDNEPIIARNDDPAEPDGPMTADFPLSRICALGERTWIAIEIRPKAEGDGIGHWSKIATVADLPPLLSMQREFCRGR
jgi:hypothetical protein